MSDIKELNDEELEKVTGGAVAQDANGCYVINQGDLYRTTSIYRDTREAGDYYALESKTTNNLQDTVYVCHRRLDSTGVSTSDEYVTISFLNTLNYIYTICYDPHLL